MTQHKPDCTAPASLRARKITYGVSIAMFFILLILLFCFVGQPMMAMASDPQAFREWISGYGVWSRFLVVGMVAFQVVVAVIPGEPIEIACGYLFGIWEGTLLCLAGITLGSLLVFLLVRRFGMRAAGAGGGERGRKRSGPRGAAGRAGCAFGPCKHRLRAMQAWSTHRAGIVRRPCRLRPRGVQTPLRGGMRDGENGCSGPARKQQSVRPFRFLARLSYLCRRNSTFMTL